MSAQDTFMVRVYVKHGIYEYEVDSADKAVEHAEILMGNGTYRRVIPEGVEIHKVYKVKALGPGLGYSEYTDTFRRT